MLSWLKKVFHSKDALSLSLPLTPISPAPTSVPRLRIVFMGTPELSANILQALVESGYQVVGIVTKADRPVGRTKTIQYSPVKEFALAHDLPLLQPEKLDETAIKAIHDLEPELIVVAAYGKILPKSLLDLPKFGCLNIHASLLPRWRGASPIQNALLSGDTETGVTIMRMDSGLDTGDIISQMTVPIDPHDTTPTLSVKILTASIKLLLETLPQWIAKTLSPQKQDEALVTLCQLIERSDGRIVWSDSAGEIYNRYRALVPWPGVFTYWKKTDSDLVRLKLLTLDFQRQNVQNIKPLGTVSEIGEKIGVQTSAGIIFLEELQMEGKKPLPVREFLRGNGDFLESVLE